jgi:hypothetical protein
LNKAKLYKLTNTLFSFLLAIAALIYLYKLLKGKVQAVDFEQVIALLITKKWHLIFVLLLMPANWAIELKKWRYLLLRYQFMNYWKSLQSLLLGILLSLLTPNRTGEIGGRLLHVNKENRWQVFYINLICSFAQLSTTFFCGLLAFIYWRDQLQQLLHINSDWILFGSIIGILLLIYSYIFSKRLFQLLGFLNQKLRSKADIIRFSLNERLYLFFFSFLRYVVFAIQFDILLMILNPTLTFADATAMVALIYMMSAIVPTAWISDLPIRTSIAYLILEQLGFSGLSGLVASVLLWLINLLLPALIGFTVLPKVNWLSITKLKSL